MLVLTVISLILVVILGFTTWNTLRKLEKYEDTVQNQQVYLERISSLIEDSSRKLREIDSKGHFMADDEVGFFFTTLHSIQDTLDDFKIS